MGTYSGKSKVWLSCAYDLQRAIQDEKLLELAVLADFESWDGYFLIGEATVTVALRDETEMVNEAIVGIRKEIQTIRSEAEIKARALEESVAQLLSIGYAEAA